MKRAASLIAGFVLVAGGCTTTTVVRDGWADFAADAAANGGQVTLGRDPASVSDRLDGRRAGDRPHRLRLASFEGPSRVADGHEATVLARQVGGLNELALLDADGVAVLYGGRFADARSPAARAALKRVRKVKGRPGTPLAGERPFRDARLVAFLTGGDGADRLAPADPLDLRGYPNLFTLQVGFFDSDAEPDRRTAAERWANQLRREQKVEAFYHHGVHRSLVTVGLFHRRDFTPERQPNGSIVEGYPKEARELQERFPLNLGNGHTVVERSGGREKEQTSRLVRTP